jgi:glutamyl-tRNA reductase
MVTLERFPADPERRLAVRRQIAALPVGPAILLETCDRVELYRGSGEVPADVRRHLARVAAGLESPLIGEKAVLGQVRQAMLAAETAGNANASLLRLFQESIAVARRVRAATGIDRGAAGHGQAVARILAELGRPLEGETVLLVGVNDLLRSILRWLAENTACSFILSNRNHDKAAGMARDFGAEAVGLSELPVKLAAAGVVVSATAAPHLIIPAGMVAAAPRLDRERLFFDLAAPLDIDPDVGGLTGCRLWNLGAVEAAVAASLDRRRELAVLAGDLVDRETTRHAARAAARMAHV